MAAGSGVTEDGPEGTASALPMEGGWRSQYGKAVKLPYLIRPRGPPPHPPTPYLYVANCGTEAEMTHADVARVFLDFGPVLAVLPAGNANRTRAFVYFGEEGVAFDEAASAAAAARDKLHGKPCAGAGGRVMQVQFAEAKRETQVSPLPCPERVDLKDI